MGLMNSMQILYLKPSRSGIEGHPPSSSMDKAKKVI
ncbi:hypothetical protein BVRB_3g057180 [Beta vulgaris subsp. vulgaris]|nr:hypothetical protein BVRB_3g057180 [Beta vulgaris subsp. vulgaris]